MCKIGLRLRIVHVVDIYYCRYLIIVQTIHIQYILYMFREETNTLSTVIAEDHKVGAMQVAGL